jgi:hypothetical protein
MRTGPRQFGQIPSTALRAMHQGGKRRHADSEIEARWKQLGGGPGAPTIPGEDGLIEVGEGFYRQYEKGRIYYRMGKQPVHVYGAIGEKYVGLGGPNSWLGWPVPRTEPNEPLTSPDEKPFPDSGRVSTFENGAIYWWPDTGAIELGNVSVRYTGLACFSTTDGFGSDEPYVLFATVPAPGTGLPSAPRTMIYTDVDGGDTREDLIELYRGLPYGLALVFVLMEHDTGDPDKYKDTVKTTVDQVVNGAGIATGAIPVVGPFLAPVAKAILQALAPDIVDAVNEVLGTGEDRVGEVSMVLSAKDMVRLTRAATKNYKGITWHLDSPLISGDGADYKAYLTIYPV